MYRMSYPGRILKNLLFLQAVCIKHSTSITTLSPCACEYNGHLYNLSSLAKKNEARFQEPSKGYMYGYNPCVPFTEGLTQECKGVAMCYWSNDGQSYEGIGFQDDVYCKENKGVVELAFRERGTRMGMTSTVQFRCNKSKILADEATMKIVRDAAEPILEIEHACCCPDGCPVVPTPFPPMTVLTLPLSTKATNIWTYIAGSIAGIVLLSIVGLIFLIKVGIICPNNARVVVLPNFPIEEDADGRPGVEHEDRNRVSDYGAVGNTCQNIIPAIPLYHDDSDSEGGREGEEHEEEIQNGPSGSLDFVFGVSKDRFTNPTQVCGGKTESCCCSA